MEGQLVSLKCPKFLHGVTTNVPITRDSQGQKEITSGGKLQMCNVSVLLILQQGYSRSGIIMHSSIDLALESITDG